MICFKNGYVENDWSNYIRESYQWHLPSIAEVENVWKVWLVSCYDRSWAWHSTQECVIALSISELCMWTISVMKYACARVVNSHAIPEFELKSWNISIIAIKIDWNANLWNL